LEHERGPGGKKEILIERNQNRGAGGEKERLSRGTGKKGGLQFRSFKP